MFGRKTLEFMLICIGDEMRDSLISENLMNKEVLEKYLLSEAMCRVRFWN